MVIWGLILARGSSKSVLNKNSRILLDKPLIAWVLEPMIFSNVFNEIWVSTDDERIADIAKRYNAKVHWRSHESASDNASSLYSIKEFLDHHNEVDEICLVQCTSPCLHPCYLKRAYDMIKSEGYDSVFSVTRNHKLRWSLDMKPLNFDPQNRRRRQEWDGEFIESGHFYLFKKELINDGLLQGSNCGSVEIPNHMCIEIDDEYDWVLTETVINKYGFRVQ